MSLAKMRSPVLLAALGWVLSTCKAPSGSESLSKNTKVAKYYGGILHFEIPYAAVDKKTSTSFWDSFGSPTSVAGKLSQRPYAPTEDGAVAFSEPGPVELIHDMLGAYVTTTQQWLKTRCTEINTNESTSYGKLRWDATIAPFAAAGVSATPNNVSSLCAFKYADKPSQWATATDEVAPELFTTYPLALAPLSYYKTNPQSFRIDAISYTTTAATKPLAVFLVSVNLALVKPETQNPKEVKYYMSGATASTAPNQPGTYQFYIAGNSVIPKYTLSYSPGFAVPIMMVNGEKKAAEGKALEAGTGTFYDFGLLVLERWAQSGEKPYFSVTTTQENATKWTSQEQIASFANLAKVAQQNPARLGTYQPSQDLTQAERQLKLHHLPIGSYSMLANAIGTQKDPTKTHGVVLQLNETVHTMRDWYVNRNQMWFSIGNRHIGEADSSRSALPNGSFALLNNYVMSHRQTPLPACNPKDLEPLAWFSDGFFTTIQVALGPSQSTGEQAGGPGATKAYDGVLNSTKLPIVSGCPKP